MYDMMPDTMPEAATCLPVMRPAILVRAARFGAGIYKRQRDLPMAVSGLYGRPAREIVARLHEAEAQCEEERLRHSAAYRPARHLQILAALIAEAGLAA